MSLPGARTQRLSATARIAEGAVVSRHIADGSVSSSKISNNAITSDKLAERAVTIDKLADSAARAHVVTGGDQDLGPIINARLADSCHATNGHRVVELPGNMSGGWLATPIEMRNDVAYGSVKNVTLRGHNNRRVALEWRGGAAPAMVNLRSRECTIDNISFFQASSGATVETAIEMTPASNTGPGAVSTGHHLQRVTISAYAGCTLTYGLRAGEQVNGWWPSNNDYMSFDGVQFFNCAHSGVYTRNENANQLFWSFDRCNFGFSPHGIYVGGLGWLSFTAHRTGLTRISEWAFRLRAFDSLQIVGLDIEQVKRLLYVDGPTSACYPATIIGGRCTFPPAGETPPYDLPADGVWIDFGCPGPLTLIGMLMFPNGYAQTNFKIKMTGPGGATGSVSTLNTIGCFFPDVVGGVDAIMSANGRVRWVRSGCSVLPPSGSGLGTIAVDDLNRQYGSTTQVTDTPLALRANRFGDTESEATFGWCTGTPEGAVAAPVGSVRINRTDGAMYRKTSGTGNTGWVTT